MTEGRETRGNEERLRSAGEVLQFAVDNKDRRGIRLKIAECGLSEELKPLLQIYFVRYTLITNTNSAGELLADLGTSLEDLLTHSPEYQIRLVELFLIQLENGKVEDALSLKAKLKSFGSPITDEQLHSQVAILASNNAITRALSKGGASGAITIAELFGMSAQLKVDQKFRATAVNYLILASTRDRAMFDRVFEKYQGIFNFDTSVLVALEQGVLTTSDL